MKGKQAAAAASRREASLERKLGELGGELAATKNALRTARADAASVPSLRAEIARLTDFVARNSSEELDRERARHADSVARLESRYDTLRGLLQRFMARVHEQAPGVKTFTRGDVELIARERLGLDCVGHVLTSREDRRTVAAPGTNTAMHRQDNRRTEEENLIGRRPAGDPTTREEAIR